MEARVTNENLDLTAISEVKPKVKYLPAISLLNINNYRLIYYNIEARDTRGVCIY